MGDSVFHFLYNLAFFPMFWTKFSALIRLTPEILYHHNEELYSSYSLYKSLSNHCIICTSRFRQLRRVRTPWLTARVQRIHVHSLRIIKWRCVLYKESLRNTIGWEVGYPGAYFIQFDFFFMFRTNFTPWKRLPQNFFLTIPM